MNTKETDVLWLRYKENRLKIGKIRASNYDITSICNLRCEGCLYFSGDDYLSHKEIRDLNEWDSFFKKEADRGINFAYIAGAEPSLVIDRIRRAYKYIPHGVVHTNGTRKIDNNILYRIHLSLWGDDSSSKKYRGVNINKTALKNYIDDKRAIVVMTINAQNIGEIMSVSQICASHNIRLTFSYFSPTDKYLYDIKNNNGANDYYRINSLDEKFLLDRNALCEAENEIIKAIEKYSKTIVYSMVFNKWVIQENGLYNLDSEGIAIDCIHRLTKKFKHFTVDLTESAGKCCSPNLSCSDCRAYAQSYANYLNRFATPKGIEFEDWLNVWELWAELFMPLRN